MISTEYIGESNLKEKLKAAVATLQLRCEIGSQEYNDYYIENTIKDEYLEFFVYHESEYNETKEEDHFIPDSGNGVIAVVGYGYGGRNGDDTTIIPYIKEIMKELPASVKLYVDEGIPGTPYSHQVYTSAQLQVFNGTTAYDLFYGNFSNLP